MTGNDRSYSLDRDLDYPLDACPPWDLKDYQETTHIYVPFSCRRCRHTFLAPTPFAKETIARHTRNCALQMSRLAQMILAKAVQMEYIQP